MGTLLFNLLLLPFQVVTVLVVGDLIRRLLGVRMGFVRMLLAAFVALWVAGKLLTAMVPNPEDVEATSAFLFLVLAACAGSLLAMVLLVIAEVLVPEGSLPGPMELNPRSRALGLVFEMNYDKAAGQIF